MLFLDQAPETGLTKFMKKATPVAQSGLKSTKSGLSKFFHFTWQASKSAHKKWKEHYGPKTKEVLKKGASHASAGIAKLGGKIRDGNQVKYMGVKVRPYSKQPTGKSSAFLASVGNIFRLIFEKQNRRYLYIGLVIVLVLLGYLKIRANNANREALNKEKAVTESYTEAVDLFNKAKDDLTLNKGSAKTDLASALDLSIKAQESPSTKDEASRLQSEIEDVIDSLIGATRFRNPAALYSVKGNVNMNALVGTSIYSFTDENKVYLTDTKDKSPKLVASIPSDSGKIVSTAYSDSTNSLYLYTDKNAVLVLDTDSNAIGKATVDEGASFETAVSASAYVSNLYLLDGSKGTIWKHILSNNSFGKGSAYNSSKDLNIKDSIGLTIDGNVYVLKPDATVVKFIRGTSDSAFSLKTLPSPLEKIDKPASIFTDSDTNYIYMLDKGRNRIIRFDKTGAFSNQYFVSGTTIDQFFVNPRIQKMWITSGSNVYEFNI
ncbi:MAG: hypothetical protein BWY58_00077 [Chloroflexi bacterium ADurb.Bin344]|nr:MAG: hypothetical protein BWY58_00077 [Chloroflexi bacterium ADurb.Bin344]